MEVACAGVLRPQTGDWAVTARARVLFSDANGSRAPARCQVFDFLAADPVPFQHLSPAHSAQVGQGHQFRGLQVGEKVQQQEGYDNLGWIGTSALGALHRIGCMTQRVSQPPASQPAGQPASHLLSIRAIPRLDACRYCSTMLGGWAGYAFLRRATGSCSRTAAMGAALRVSGGSTTIK
jgi:hypothetical protein